MPRNTAVNENYNENSPFIVRKPYVRLWQMLLFGLVMTITIYSSIYYATDHLRDFVVMLFGVLIIILFYFIQNTYFDEKTATEFQCSVYSGAMRSNTWLSFVLYQDCGIYYFDQRFNTEFSANGHVHDFDHLMKTLDISEKIQEKIANAVHDLKHFEIDHKVFDGEKRINVTISTHPIQRPRGFVYLSISKKD